VRGPGATVRRPGQDRIRVLVTDDTAIIRRMVTDVLGEYDDIEVVGTAANGELALAAIERLKPDVVTLDVEMPVLDGLETLLKLRKVRKDLPVIMFSSLTEAGASATLDALANGANDYVMKPSATRNRAEALDAVRSSLIPLLRLWGRPGARRRAAAPAPAPTAAAARPVPTRTAPADRRPPLAVVIGVSTGGPDALAAMLPKLPRDLPVPIVVVQHMPPLFTRMLADRLDQQSQVHVVEAADGMELEPGTVYLAAGGRHLRLDKRRDAVVCVLDDSPPENSCRPSVDVTLRSALDVWGSRTLVVILTGMGQDGLLGARALKEQGAHVVVQDENTSAVWGMPGAVAKGGYADRVLPLPEIAPAVATAVARRAVHLAGRAR
jgi:two-component system, chemotaxis family, protein-glutamate methylesterase/glutaminase